MKKKLITIALTALIAFNNFAQQKKWTILSDGKTFDNWHVYNKAGQPVEGSWKIENGAMVLGKDKGSPNGNDLISDKEYENFVLELDWKISEGGNSGIFYAVHEDPTYKMPYLTSPEIQVLDNENHPDAKKGTNGNRKAGSLYDMIPSKSPSKPFGEWNHVKIKKQNGVVTVWQNGKLAEKFNTLDDSWTNMVANSKFKDWDAFGKYQKGHIGLQDHGDMVSYKDIKIMEL